MGGNKLKISHTYIKHVNFENRQLKTTFFGFHIFVFDFQKKIEN